MEPVVWCPCVVLDSCSTQKYLGLLHPLDTEEEFCNNDLKMKGSGQTVTLTKAPLNPLANRGKIAKPFPKQADVPALCVHSGCVHTLSFWSQHRLHGRLWL